MNKESERIKWKIFRFLILPFTVCLFTCLCFAQTLAPGAPGKDAQWATAGKQGVGTSATLESKVWFTLAEGVMTEVYYPDVTTANVHLLQFVVVNPKTKKVETEQDDATHEIKIDSIDRTKNVSPLENLSIYKNFQSSGSLAFTQISRSKVKAENGISKSGLIIGGETFAWTITKNYVSNPKNNSVIFSVEFKTDDPNNELYIYYDPSLANSGMGDTAWTKGNTLLAKDKNYFSALSCRYCKFAETTNGFLGVNDGFTQLKNAGKIEKFYDKAENGNVVQVAKIIPVFNGGSEKEFRFEIALGFGTDEKSAEKASNESLLTGFNNVKEYYQKEWIDYIKTLPKVDAKYQAQFNMAAMILKAHEDKTVRGANIASLTIPWGGDKNANENTVGGYHLVWSRDLYQVATAFMALGDAAAANRALDFVFNVQQKPDGSFPQNSKLDGTPFWGSLQLDEVAFPLILAYQLGRNDKPTWENHIKKAADLIVKTGPKTPQERWEEKGGYSPSTIAAEIAGLVCAAEIARKNNDNESANLYLKTADDWQANIEKWTATTNGKYGDGNYYVRITQNGKPDAGEKIELNNNSGTFQENEIVDAGFLELVRLGIKSPDDPLIIKSLKVIDAQIKVDTPNGAAFYRYNHDGYGEMDDGRRWNWDGKYTGKGRLWALLSGERGQYEIALASSNSRLIKIDSKGNTNSTQKDFDDLATSSFYSKKAISRLEAMSKFANDGLMIPEQIWDSPNVPSNIDKQFIPELKFGEGTGSATPLAWSMAQFIRLAVNLQKGKNLDTPDVVYNRYVLGIKSSVENQKAENDKEALRMTIPPCEQAFKNTLFAQSPIVPSENWKPSSVPEISPISANFFYRGNAKEIEVVGDFTGWKPQGLKLKNVLETDWKCYQVNFAPTARVEYKLIVDSNWMTDPLNPNVVDNGVGGENSVLTMPDYQATEWLKYQASAAEKFFLPSKTEEIELQSKSFGSNRIKVYLPGGYDSPSKLQYPVLYLMDGTDYVERAKAILIQQTLVDARKIKPFIMVFLDPKDRMKEYWANDDYAKYLAAEVVPAIDAKYNTIKNRDGRAILGASLGGVTSIHTGVKYPDVFRRIGGQSSSFWIDNERVIKELETLDASKNNFVFYLDTGTLEGAADDRKAVEILRKKGYGVTYEEREAGHNWTAWRDRLADAFIALFGK